MTSLKTLYCRGCAAILRPHLTCTTKLLYYWFYILFIFSCTIIWWYMPIVILPLGGVKHFHEVSYEK